MTSLFDLSTTSPEGPNKKKKKKKKKKNMRRRSYSPLPSLHACQPANEVFFFFFFFNYVAKFLKVFAVFPCIKMHTDVELVNYIEFQFLSMFRSYSYSSPIRS
jgi:hypothetical protein